jgi:hypothetical protein
VFEGKMIVVESLWDREALPWQADWYRERVREHLGAATDASFRLWYTDRALHGFDLKQEDETRTVTFLPVLQQALRDLSAWVEKGVVPPATTRYRIADGQIVLPPTARERLGVQPVVTVTIGGKDRAEVAAGQTVEFAGTIEAPPGAGKIVRAEWDFEGKGLFADNAAVEPGQKVTLRARHTFARPGTYFTTLRGYSHRDGNDSTPFARIRNLGRVRVVVK